MPAQIRQLTLLKNIDKTSTKTDCSKSVMKPVSSSAKKINFTDFKSAARSFDSSSPSVAITGTFGGSASDSCGKTGSMPGLSLGSSFGYH
jgi:hypothetical protein